MKAVEGEGEHGEDLSDGLDRDVTPVAWALRVEPRDALEVIAEALKPRDPGGEVLCPPVDGATGLEEFDGVHHGVADEDKLVVGAVAGEKLGDGEPALEPGIFVDSVVDAVVKIVGVEVAEVLALHRGGEELAHHLGVGRHAAADVHEEEELHVVAPRRAPDELEVTGVLAGLVDGLVEVEFETLTITPEVAELSEGDLNLTDVKDEIASIGAIAPIHGDLGCASGTTLAADTDPCWVLSAVAKGRGTAGPDPPIASRVTLLLFSEALCEEFSERVEVEGGEGRELFIAEVSSRRGIGEPGFELVRELEAVALDTLENDAEGLVVGVEVRLAVDQDRAAEVIEGREAAFVKPRSEGSEEGDPLLGPDGDLLASERVEKIEKHGCLGPSACSTVEAFYSRDRLASLDLGRGGVDALHVSFVLDQGPEKGGLEAELRGVDARTPEGRDPVEELARRGTLAQAVDLA